MSITKETALAVYMRAGYRCENDLCLENLINGGWELHHNNFKSQYRMDDRDEARNLSLLCAICHRDNVKWVHGQNIILRLELQRRSEIRKPKSERSQEPKKTAKHRKSSQAKKRIEREARQKDRLYGVNKFKESHGGLTPSQYAYKKQREKQKEYAQSLLLKKIEWSEEIDEKN